MNCKAFLNRKKFVKVVIYNKDTYILGRYDGREKRKSNGSDAGR